MQNKPYSIEFKQLALSKARQRGARTLQSVADELNITLGTLKGFIANRAQIIALPENGAASDWSLEQRLLALQESHALSGEALAAWCLEKGLFEHQLQQWRSAFCQPPAAPAEAKAELRALQRSHAELQREIQRKDKALAEAAALLILQKKFQALLEDGER